MSQYQIDEVYEKHNNYQYIVDFQNGYPTSKFEKAPCLILEDKNCNKTVATEISGLVYAGNENEEEIGKTLILARDKTTGKIRLIEVGSVSVKPSMKSDLETTQLMDTSNLELGRKFGSKKHKKSLEQREKLKLNDLSVAEQMKNVTQNVSIDIKEISVLDRNNPDEFYLPYCNRDAKTVEYVYPLEKMLPADVYDKAYQEIEDVDLPPLLMSCIQLSLTDHQSKHNRVLALLANVLFTIATKSIKEVSIKSYMPCKISATLNTYVLHNFFREVNSRRTRSINLKDKAICHGIVFLLLVSNFKFNFDNLCTDLKMPFKQLSTKLKMTGAQLMTIDKKQFAVLKLPLLKMPLKRYKKK